MKIALLTFFYAHNVGANLQAYALKTTLESLGHEVMLVNYRNKTILKNHCSRTPPPIKILSKRWLKPTNWGELLYNIRRNHYCKRAWARRWAVFQSEILTLFGDLGSLVYYDELSSIDADAFIVGSDQIWNRRLTGDFDKAYFLAFPTIARKIAYAASMDNFRLSGNKLREFRSLLGNFDSISTREQYLAHSIADVTGGSVSAVLDPTLLLRAEDYRSLQCNRRLFDGRFVFVYEQSKNNKLSKAADDIAHKLGCSVIELHNFDLPELTNRNIVTEVGYSEFLWYMDNAEFIITNSFHGVCFSILFNKPFYSIYGSGQNKRIHDLLERLTLTDRHKEDVKQISLNNLNYVNTCDKLSALRCESIDYLKIALNRK